MEHSIIYSTVDQQIEKLKQQGLTIVDEDFARYELELCGYSNLIKSYREPYTFSKDGKKAYRTGVTFEQIHSLYLLDKNLRNAVIAAMLDLEEHIKEASAEVIANSFGVHQDDYLQFRNYSDKKKRKPRFSLSGILKSMQNTLETDRNPIHHYAQKYDIVPPWILFKSVYFSTIINFIGMLKPRERDLLSKKLYSDLNEDDNQKRAFLMMDSMFIWLEYRNLAAHGGRTYNHECQSQLRSTESLGATLAGISLLLVTLGALDYSAPHDFLSHALDAQINRHCHAFPQDVTYLGQVLNLNITSTHYVWTTDRSNKYHNEQHCSGIKNAARIELSEAKEQNLLPCQKCCR